MDLKELEIHVEKARKKAEEEAAKRTYWQPGGKTWTEERAEEDALLVDMKCPKCKKDVELNVYTNTYYYRCKTDRTHTFIRYTEVKKPVAGDPKPKVIEIDTTADTSIYGPEVWD